MPNARFFFQLTINDFYLGNAMHIAHCDEVCGAIEAPWPVRDLFFSIPLDFLTFKYFVFMIFVS